MADEVADRFRGVGVSYASLLDDDERVDAPTADDLAPGQRPE